MSTGVTAIPLTIRRRFRVTSGYCRQVVSSLHRATSSYQVTFRLIVLRFQRQTYAVRVCIFHYLKRISHTGGLLTSAADNSRRDAHVFWTVVRSSGRPCIVCLLTPIPHNAISFYVVDQVQCNSGWKGLQGQRLEVKVTARPSAPVWRRLSFPRCDAEAHTQFQYMKMCLSVSYQATVQALPRLICPQSTSQHHCHHYHAAAATSDANPAVGWEAFNLDIQHKSSPWQRGQNVQKLNTHIVQFKYQRNVTSHYWKCGKLC